MPVCVFVKVFDPKGRTVTDTEMLSFRSGQQSVVVLVATGRCTLRRNYSMSLLDSVMSIYYYILYIIHAVNSEYRFTTRRQYSSSI